MALREVLARFGIEVEDGKLKAADGQIGALTGKLRDMATLVGGAAIVGGLRNVVSEVVDLGGSITDTAAKLGVGTSDLQRWQFAAGQTGVEAGALNGALTKFTRTIGEAATGNAGAVDAFKALGVEVKDANGNIGSSTDLMLGAAQGLSEIQDPALRAKAAIDLFGKSGADLIPLLGKGADGVQALLDEADKLGGVLDESTIAALDDAGDASDKFDFAMRGVKAQLALAILPALTAAGGKLAELVGAFTKGEGGAQHLKAALVTLGAVAFATGVRAALPWLGWAVIIAGLILIVDDLWTGLKGGDSVTGRILDRLLGKGAGASIFKAIREDVGALWARMREAPNALGAVEEALSTIGASIVRFFKDDIPEAISYAFKDDALVARADALFRGALDVFAGLGPTMLNKGTQAAINLVSGLAEGIKAGAVRVVAAVGEMASAAAAKLGEVFESHSPSELGKRHGNWLGDGLALGAQAATPRVSSAVANMAGAGARALVQGTQGPSGPRSFNQTNHIQIAAQGTGAGAVRTGVVGGLADAGRAALEYLETGVG